MNSFGRIFRTTIFGESHGRNIGVVIDGIPAGTEITEDMLATDLERRKSGAAGTTPRKESDRPVIVSGVLDNCATGAPVTILFENRNTASKDYDAFRALPRPGHSDFSASVKYNFFNDLRGGGHFSGRLTLGIVAAGTIAKKILADTCKNVSIQARLIAIGGETDTGKWDAMIEDTVSKGDSLGGLVECRCSGLPAGMGEPFFDSVESLVSHIVFAVPGVRGIEFGDGFRAAAMKGSEHNDRYVDSHGKTATNGCGGINGGITNGNEIVFRVAFKPTASIAAPQETYNFIDEKMDTLLIEGRHDACFALRTPVIIESAAAIVLTDLLLLK